MPRGRLEEGPPRRDPDEIDMTLVKNALEIRNQTAQIPISREAIEYVRWLRATGYFDGKERWGTEPIRQEAPGSAYQSFN